MIKEKQTVIKKPVIKAWVKKKKNGKNKNKIKNTTQVTTVKTFQKPRFRKSTIRGYGISPYLYSLAFPEDTIGARVPHQYSVDTIYMHRHVTLSLTVNASGKACFFWQPFQLWTGTGNSLSSFFYQNNAAYNGTTTFTGDLIPQIINWTLPTANISSYRLVSASMQVLPQIAPLSAAGKIGAAVTAYPEYFTSSNITDTSIQTFTNIENFSYYSEADVCALQGLRLVWYPQDNHDYELYNVAANTSITGGTQSETTFVGYFTQLPANATINFELYSNFEVTPFPGSVLTGMAKPNFDTSDPMFPLIKLKKNPTLISQPTKGNHTHRDGLVKLLETNTGKPQGFSKDGNVTKIPNVDTLTTKPGMITVGGKMKNPLQDVTVHTSPKTWSEVLNLIKGAILLRSAYGSGMAIVDSARNIAGAIANDIGQIGGQAPNNQRLPNPDLPDVNLRNRGRGDFQIEEDLLLM
jgi:hypothetical protein